MRARFATNGCWKQKDLTKPRLKPALDGGVIVEQVVVTVCTAGFVRVIGERPIS